MHEEIREAREEMGLSDVPMPKDTVTVTDTDASTIVNSLPTNTTVVTTSDTSQPAPTE
jgi:hypothetical protein